MSDKEVNASVIRAAMHKAVDQLIDTIEELPAEILTGDADGEEVSFIGSDINFRDQPWFQETAADYDQNTLYHQLQGLEARNKRFAEINEETKGELAQSQAEWDEKSAADPKWNLPRPRELNIVDPRTRAGYHLLDEDGGSLQELFRENLY